MFVILLKPDTLLWSICTEHVKWPFIVFLLMGRVCIDLLSLATEIILTFICRYCCLFVFRNISFCEKHAPKTLNYLALQPFDFERTWSRLLQKRVVRTNFDIYVGYDGYKPVEQSHIHRQFYSIFNCKFALFHYVELKDQTQMNIQITNLLIVWWWHPLNQCHDYNMLAKLCYRCLWGHKI